MNAVEHIQKAEALLAEGERSNAEYKSGYADLAMVHAKLAEIIISISVAEQQHVQVYLSVSP